MAWLSACPEDGKGKSSKETNYTKIKNSGKEPEMPPLDGGEYIIELFNEVGHCESTGFGAGAVSWTNLKSWYDLSGLALSSWELLLIRELSQAFANEYNKKDNAQPPYKATVSKYQMTGEKRKKVEDDLLAAFEVFKAK
jgi:hypothetical protein